MYKYTQGILPKSLNVTFYLGLDVHTYNTENCNTLNVNFCLTKYKQSTVSYLRPLLRNSLDDSLKQSISISIFKKTVKPAWYKLTFANPPLQYNYATCCCICCSLF